MPLRTEDTNLRKLCHSSESVHHFVSRREFLKSASALGAAVTAGLSVLHVARAAAQTAPPPPGTGAGATRYLIRGGAVLSMDTAVGDFAEADVLVEGTKILAVGPHLKASDAAVIEAKGMI